MNKDNAMGNEENNSDQVPANAANHLTSTTTDSSDDTASLIILPAGMNYERDNENQKLIAVMGREFDLPLLIAENLYQFTWARK